MLNLFKKKSIMKPCCDCCCFKDQIEAHRNLAEEELKNLLTTWLKNHSEVERVCIGNKNLFSSSVSLSQKSEIDITIYFDKY
jgi:hypothetical protein